MPSFFSFLRGTPTSEQPKPTPLLPTFREKVTGAGEYMHDIRKISQENLNLYRQEKRRMKEEWRRQDKKFEKRMGENKEDFYGKPGYNIARYEKNVELAKKHGNSLAEKRAEQRLNSVQKRADEKWERREFHQREDRYLDREQQKRDLRRKFRDMRRDKIAELRESSRNTSFSRGA